MLHCYFMHLYHHYMDAHAYVTWLLLYYWHWYDTRLPGHGGTTCPCEAKCHTE